MFNRLYENNNIYYRLKVEIFITPYSYLNPAQNRSSKIIEGETNRLKSAETENQLQLSPILVPSQILHQGLKPKKPKKQRLSDQLKSQIKITTKKKQEQQPKILSQWRYNNGIIKQRMDEVKRLKCEILQTSSLIKPDLHMPQTASKACNVYSTMDPKDTDTSLVMLDDLSDTKVVNGSLFSTTNGNNKENEW